MTAAWPFPQEKGSWCSQPKRSLVPLLWVAHDSRSQAIISFVSPVLGTRKALSECLVYTRARRKIIYTWEETLNAGLFSLCSQALWVREEQHRFGCWYRSVVPSEV